VTISSVDAAYSVKLPPADAIAHLQAKGAQVTGSWREWRDGQHARAFTVANVAKLDVLQDIQASLGKALAEGQTLASWKDGLVPQLQKKGWWGRGGSVEQLRQAGRVDETSGEIRKGLNAHRLETIFQTNMQSAYMAGRYAEMMEQAEDRPFWEYVAILDARTRPAHRAMHGRIFRYDDPGWRSFYPPCGYKCRCRVRNFSQADVKRRKLTVESTDGKLSQVQVPLRGGGSASVTRYTERSLQGGKFQPDPGFSNNPGLMTWQPRLEAADVQLSRRYVETAVQGPAFERFIQRRDAQGNFPVGVLQPARAAALQVEQPVVYLQAERLATEAARRPARPADEQLADFRQIPQILDDGEAHRQGNNRILFLFEGAPHVLRLAVSVSAREGQLNVMSLARVTVAKAQEEIKRLKP
jgi:SPP1 gp7 family putative phage head morphogenesis protein